MLSDLTANTRAILADQLVIEPFKHLKSSLLLGSCSREYDRVEFLICTGATGSQNDWSLCANYEARHSIASLNYPSLTYEVARCHIRNEQNIRISGNRTLEALEVSDFLAECDIVRDRSLYYATLKLAFFPFP